MTVTVFTPAYNRAHLLERLFESLLSQTDKDFEWVIVDDGSTDGTEALLKDITSRELPFPIICEKQENGGKHRAVNKGVSLASGDIFFTVDSDDYVTPDAIEKIKKWYNAIPEDERSRYAAVSGARGSEDGVPLGGVYTEAEYVDARNNERDGYGLTGDQAEAYFTDILRKYPFPEIEGERFITEEVVWNKIAADGYLIRWYSDIIYICKYLDGGLTSSVDKNRRNNPKGVLLWAKGTFEAYPNSKKRRMSAVYTYRKAVKGTKSLKETASDLGVSRIFVIMSTCAAFAVRTLRRLRGSK